MSEFGFPDPNTFLQTSIHEHSYLLLNAMVVCIPFFLTGECFLQLTNVALAHAYGI